MIISFLIFSFQPAIANSQAEWLRRAVTETCGPDDLTGLQIQDALPGTWLLEETKEPNDSAPRRIVARLSLPNGDQLSIERRQANGRLRQFRASYHTFTGHDTEPALLAIADGGCGIQSGRLIRSDGDIWRYLDQLDADLTTVRWTETLQAPWPSGTDPGGVRVALVDSGLAYDLPVFKDSLARDMRGEPLGYDYWDLDPWPYDGDISRGPFLPIRHGTPVASILLREAPGVAIMPMRYPRPAMERMADVVRDAVNAGARVIAMPLGSRQKQDWLAFETALSGLDVLAIVSAGNDGRDIDLDPIYPAALALDNILTVTSSDGSGRLAPGSNWGRQSVDIMLPAERMRVLDFRGAVGQASGSSYAVPRLAALAARILAKDPDMKATTLKARLLARAVQSPFEVEGRLAAGWIPDPASN